MAYIGNEPGVSSQRVVSTFTATSGQTTFTPISGYTLGYIDVYLNGIKLVDGDDYTAANGMTVVLASGAAVGDSVECVAFFPRGLSDGYLKSEADARYVGLTGDQTIAGVKTFSGSATIVNGNLGVGTSSVLGNSTFNAALGIAVRNQSTSMGYFQTYNANAGSNLKTWRWGSDASGNLVFETVNDAYSSATQRVTLGPGGFVGIGQTNPAYSLDILANTGNLLVHQTRAMVIDTERNLGGITGGGYSTGTTIVDAAQIGFASSGAWTSTSTPSYISFATTASGSTTLTERARIDSSGKLLVGRSSAQGTTTSVIQGVGAGNLSSVTVTRANTSGIYLTETSGTANYGTGIWFDHGSLLAGIASSRVSTGNWGTDLRFYTHPTTTSAVDETYERGRFSAAGDFELYITPAKDGKVQWTSGAGGSAQGFIVCNGNPELIAQCGGSGGVKLTSGATSWVSASDIRSKDIIEPIANAIQKVGSLSSVIYSFKDDVEQTRRVGLIAQEVLAVLPEAVYVPSDEEEMLGVRYTEVVPLMVAAIKEQQAIIEQLRADVQALKEAA